MGYTRIVDQECITVVIERVTFTNPQNGYSVLRTTAKGRSEPVTVVGNFGPLHPGEEIRVHGTWTCHPQFGPQFHSFRYSTLKPATLRGMEKYLGSGLIKGIGPVTAKRLVAAFGTETLDVIENDPERLATCPGVGPSRSSLITAGWTLQKAVHDVMIFLQGHGISTAYAVRIFRKFGNDAVKKVADNPYLLAHEVHGIGFKTADKIAGEFGISGSDPRRLRAGITYVLQNFVEEGHLFLEREDLVAKAGEILEVDLPGAISEAIDGELLEKRLVARAWKEKSLIYLPFAFHDETGVCSRVSAFLGPSRSLDRPQLVKALDRAMESCGATLSEAQALAVERSLRESFLIITGGPGTGKTTTLKALVEAHFTLGRRVLLASPTGRAAKRLSEVTGRPAVTIHRLLEFDPSVGKFKRSPGNPLPVDTLVVDEASMIDMCLCHSLLKAIPLRSTVILVGDSDQLPSVGPGLVFRHMIESGVVPVSRLETIFRQAQESLIITNAHRINKGEFPVLVTPDGKTQSDCYFLDAPDPEKALGLLANVAGSSLPKRFGFHPTEDIQVLSPMNRGSLGAANLNKVLQEALNPASPEKPEYAHMHRVFRLGDKVIQNRNNYDLEVFNGDIGFVRKVESEDQEITIEFPQGMVTYQPPDLLDLSHAFAITVHKSQGSEYPCVVLLAATQHYMLLQRNLLYTGITRAKKKIVLIGSKKALAMAIRNDRIKQRNTILKELLSETGKT